MNDDPAKYVAYLRVSTRQQEQSGLGLEAQRARVSEYVERTGGLLMAEFVEVESGRKKNRKVLTEALSYCRRSKSTLVLAKLDRLSRSVHFISGLMESRVDFIDIENPSKDPLWLHLRAVIGEHELRMISARTKDALRAAKARGVDIGATGRVLARRNRLQALEKAEDYRVVVDELRASGIDTVRGVMAELNDRQVQSPGNARWHYRSTWKMLQRLRVGGGEEGRHEEFGAAVDSYYTAQR